LDDDPKSYAIKEQLILMLPNTNLVRKKRYFGRLVRHSLENENKEYGTCGYSLFPRSSNFDVIDQVRRHNMQSNIINICFEDKVNQFTKSLINIGGLFDNIKGF
jgi:hypothetical protein